MQDYYNKKAKECEMLVARLQQQVAKMQVEDSLILQEQMKKVKREMANYKAAVEAAAVDY